MYPKIIKNILFPLYQMKIPPDERFITQLKLMEKTQWWSYSEIKKLQLRRLKKLLHHANNNVPFYHKIFKKLNFLPENISKVEDLNKLPILTKEIIRNNFEDLYARNYLKENLIPTCTSGSTGSPMNFYVDRKWNACNNAAAFRAWSWASYNLGDKIAYLWGAPSDINNTSKRDKIRNYLLRTIYLDAFNLTNENMAIYANILSKCKPKIINTYASAIFLFSQYLKEEEINSIRPRSIITTADMLYKYQRKTIEQVFDCEVFDYYSGRDTSLQAAECSEHTGYHLSIENAVVEFLKKNEPVYSGQTGNIILTDLSNYAMPFIRYEIGDLGTPSDEMCPCGRNLPLMKSLNGRIFDVIVTPEGKHLTGEYFHYAIIDHNIQGIKEFQIIQNSPDKLVIYIVKNPLININDSNRFINIIQKMVGENVEIKLQYLPYIKRNPSGKLRHVISNIKKST